MRMTEAEYQAYEVRRAARDRVSQFQTEAVDEYFNDCESALHDQIINYSRQHEWVIVHSRMDKASTTAVGVADFVLLLPEGKTVIVECKRKGSKPTPQQLGFIAHCKKNGHTAAVVWSFAEFLALVNPAVSTCCRAPMRVVGSGEGTNHYECEKCHQDCDGIRVS